MSVEGNVDVSLNAGVAGDGTNPQVVAPGAIATVFPPNRAQYPSLGSIAVSLESFNGKEVIRYFDKLEQRSQLDSWTKVDTLKILKYRLAGPAYDYFKSDTTLDALSYDEFKIKLITKFSHRKRPGEDQLNLNRCLQGPGEEVNAFCTRIRILGGKVLKEDLRSANAGEESGLRRKNQELMVNQFKLGLKKDLFRLVGAELIGTDNLSLERCEELAEHHEMVQEIIQGRRLNHDIAEVREVVCYRCKKIGHISRNCSQSEGERPCFICKKVGHWANQCPQKQENSRPCFICKELGHWANRCPQRTNNEGAQGSGSNPNRSRFSGSQKVGHDFVRSDKANVEGQWRRKEVGVNQEPQATQRQRPVNGRLRQVSTEWVEKRQPALNY